MDGFENAEGGLAGGRDHDVGQVPDLPLTKFWQVGDLPHGAASKLFTLTALARQVRENAVGSGHSRGKLAVE
jgi:hypothetical protein